MSETSSHKRAKSSAAGRAGRTEVSISRGRRLDALSPHGKRATEIERSGNTRGLRAAASRLKATGANQKVLQVPQNHIPLAIDAMKNKNVKGTVKNMSGTKSVSVR